MHVSFHAGEMIFFFPRLVGSVREKKISHTMSEPFKVLREILRTGDTHGDFFAMCDLLEEGLPPQFGAAEMLPPPSSPPSASDDGGVYTSMMHPQH